MKRVVMILAAATLLIAAAPCGRADSAANAAKANKLDAAKLAEEKGDLARARKDNSSAVSYYLIALRASHQDANLNNKLGVAELQLRDRARARRYFAQALKYDPQLVSAINNIGAVALIDKKYRLAVNYFKQALAIDESSAVTHLNLGEAWIGLGETDRAMTEYARALEIDADILSDEPEGVIALVATSEQRARVSFMIAKAYMKHSNLDGALEYLRRAKEQRFPDLAKVYTDPDFAPLWKDPRLAKIVKR